MLHVSDTPSRGANLPAKVLTPILAMSNTPPPSQQQSPEQTIHPASSPLSPSALFEAYLETAILPPDNDFFDMTWADDNILPMMGTSTVQEGLQDDLQLGGGANRNPEGPLGHVPTITAEDYGLEASSSNTLSFDTSLLSLQARPNSPAIPNSFGYIAGSDLEDTQNLALPSAYPYPDGSQGVLKPASSSCGTCGVDKSLLSPQTRPKALRTSRSLGFQEKPGFENIDSVLRGTKGGRVGKEPARRMSVVSLGQDYQRGNQAATNLQTPRSLPWTQPRGWQTPYWLWKPQNRPYMPGELIVPAPIVVLPFGTMEGSKANVHIAAIVDLLKVDNWSTQPAPDVGTLVYRGVVRMAEGGWIPASIEPPPFSGDQSSIFFVLEGLPAPQERGTYAIRVRFIAGCLDGGRSSSGSRLWCDPVQGLQLFAPCDNIQVKHPVEIPIHQWDMPATRTSKTHPGTGQGFFVADLTCDYLAPRDADEIACRQMIGDDKTYRFEEAGSVLCDSIHQQWERPQRRQLISESRSQNELRESVNAANTLRRRPPPSVRIPMPVRFGPHELNAESLMDPDNAQAFIQNQLIESENKDRVILVGHVGANANMNEPEAPGNFGGGRVQNPRRRTTTAEQVLDMRRGEKGCGLM